MTLLSIYAIINSSSEGHTSNQKGLNMDKKQMFVEVVNLETGKVFSLPTLYTDRTEACICGQNYVRDRQAEDPCSEIFFRVLISEDGAVNDSYNMRDEEEEDEDDEEPEHGESVYGNAEETPSKSLAEILSEFSVNRSIY